MSENEVDINQENIQKNMLDLGNGKKSFCKCRQAGQVKCCGMNMKAKEYLCTCSSIM